MTDEINPFDKILEGLSDETQVDFFNNDKYAGIEIRFSRPGFGFGAVTISFDIVNKKWGIDNEAMSKETCAQFLNDASLQIMEKLFALEDPQK